MDVRQCDCRCLGMAAEVRTCGDSFCPQGMPDKLREVGRQERVSPFRGWHTHGRWRGRRRTQGGAACRWGTVSMLPVRVVRVAGRVAAITVMRRCPRWGKRKDRNFEDHQRGMHSSTIRSIHALRLEEGMLRTADKRKYKEDRSAKHEHQRVYRPFTLHATVMRKSDDEVDKVRRTKA